MANNPSAAYSSYGIKIHTTDGASPPTAYEIYNVTNVTFSGPTIEDQDTTAHNTGNPDREFLPTLRNNGTMQITVNWVPSHATHAGPTSAYSLEYQWYNRSRRTWRVVFTDPSLSAYSFTGFISEFPLPDADVAGINQRTVTVKISGPVTREFQYAS